MNSSEMTSIEFLVKYNTNNVFIKRDDINLPPFGGNKVRKLNLFLEEAKKEQADYIVTYGSAQSNHCRLAVAMAKKIGFNVLLILAKGDELNYNGNFLIYDLYDAEIVWTETNLVPETIERTLEKLKCNGHIPYFIQGGGHGDLGAHAYKIAFDEIIQQEEQMNIRFNRIFHASGTGTTQAGLIAGNIVHGANKIITGISVARKSQRGSEVIKESVQSYLNNYYSNLAENNFEIIFIDEYIGKAYADIYPEVMDTIKRVAKQSGVLLDPVYTGKAFFGMLETIKRENIQEQNVLFIHTGGVPLLFNYADEFRKRYE